MVVCTFFQQGRCRFGDRCKNEHPGSQSAFNQGNRFGVLQSQETQRTPASAFLDGSGKQGLKYGLNATGIQLDMTAGKERPMWIFSAYGPGKDAPVQLFGGPQREQSPEEMRALHYAATAAGNPQQAVQDANNLYAQIEAQMQTILNDVEAAIKYVMDGEKTHPNRLDIVEGKTSPGLGGAAAPSPFGQPSTTAQPASGMQGSAFGKPSGFGQPSSLASNAPTFGQPSPFGQQQQQQQPAFGKSPFGQPGGFGQPSTLGAAQPTGFGQPSSGFGKTAFGQPSAIQTQTQQQNPSPFGQPSAASPFAQLNQGQQQQQQPQQPQGTGFSGFGSQAQTTSPFAQQATAQPTNPFGQSTQPAPAQATGPFGQPQQTPAAAQGFGTTTTALTAKKPDTKDLNPLPPLQGETRRDPMTKKLVSWKGQAVKYLEDEPCYQHPDNPAVYVHIYFPDGPPTAETLRDAAGKPEEYTPEVEAAYKFLKEHGKFKDGIVPSVPPKPEWCSFDF